MMLVARGSSGALLAAGVVGRRAMGTVAKGTARAAVHGLRSPTNTAVEGREEAVAEPGSKSWMLGIPGKTQASRWLRPWEEVEAAIEKGKEEKRKMREDVEAKVDDAQIGSSSPAPPHSKSDK